MESGHRTVSDHWNGIQTDKERTCTLRVSMIRGKYGSRFCRQALAGQRGKGRTHVTVWTSAKEMFV